MNLFWIIAVLLATTACGFIIQKPQSEEEQQPQPWPVQFHALLLQSYGGKLATIDLWYDWTNGRNYNIIRDQLATSYEYDLEWTNGTSFFFNLDKKTCRTVHVPVGILRPNWLQGADYIGEEEVNGIKCNVWNKAKFIKYWEDIATKWPVKWIFYTGRVIDVLRFEDGAAMEDDAWQAPAYCF